MLKLTEAAIKLMDGIKRPEGRVLRLQLTGDGAKLGLVLGPCLDDDLVVRLPGHQPVHISAYLGGQFTNAVLDRADSPAGPSLSLRRPA